MKRRDNSLKMILKFDTGRDGFEKMIFVLAVSAAGVLILGVYFLIFEFNGIVQTG